MSKARIVMEIVTLLQGTPIDEFARQNLYAEGNRVLAPRRQSTTVATAAGVACRQGIATALRRYSYRFTSAQLTVLADLYATALELLEPGAAAAVRDHMCDATSEEALRDA